LTDLNALNKTSLFQYLSVIKKNGLCTIKVFDF